MRRSETPYPIWVKLCKIVDIHCTVSYTNFSDLFFWFRSDEGGGGQVLPFPIDFDHRRPYNTLALPYECVMLSTGFIQD